MINIELMIDEAWIYTRSFICTLREHINIFFEKFNQSPPLLRRQFSLNLKEFLLIITNDYSLQIFAFCLVG